MHAHVRVFGLLTIALLVAAGLQAAPAEASTRASSRYLLHHLVTGYEHRKGYDRDLFRALGRQRQRRLRCPRRGPPQGGITRPRVGSGCSLSGGAWRSKYDGVETTEPSSFDIDHMVPLNEAWQSGAWRWNPDTRRRFANDLSYWPSLIAVTASSNRSKSDREPQDWMPDRASYGCKYVKQWVAIKWRWRPKVNENERTFLRRELRACGWPRVVKPVRASIGTGSTSTGGGGGGWRSWWRLRAGLLAVHPARPPDIDCSDVDGPILCHRY